ncbi:DNA replication and repair protein RecF [Candidatus Curtissbacteria bacterium]|nr:DNA replication and repair protein RecF [Candidatus Curtissbacteria bacterium]
MEILSLNLINFRNFSSQKIAFDKNLTVVIGPNGAGKSNILEACGLLATVRSSRVKTDLDLVKFGKSEAKVEGKVESQSGKNVLTINFQVIDETYVKKSYFIDEIKKRYIDFSEHFSVVIFEPLDLDLVSGSPSLRRHHLDILLSSGNRAYWRSLSSYNKVVVRRNKVLWRIAEGKSKPSELDFWDERFLEHGKIVSQKRHDFFEFLNASTGSAQVLSESANSSTPGVKRAYTPGVSLGGFSWELKQSLLSEEKLLRNRERDIAAGITLSGPHRDDFRFLFKNKDLEFFGARGDQRMAVLALKLAELEYMATKRFARPVLALDDIFSELDHEHREAVLDVIGKQQVIITAAEPDSLPKKIFTKAKVVELR